MSDRWIDKYRLVEDHCPQGLAAKVNEIIIDGAGWQPYGGPMVDGSRLVQAMVRYEKEDA